MMMRLIVLSVLFFLSASAQVPAQQRQQPKAESKVSLPKIDPEERAAYWERAARINYMMSQYNSLAEQIKKLETELKALGEEQQSDYRKLEVKYKTEGFRLDRDLKLVPEPVASGKKESNGGK